VFQYSRSLELSMETFSGGCGRCIEFICKKQYQMAMFGYTCELITRLKPKQQEI